MDDIQTIFDSDEAENEYMKEQEARRLEAEEKKQIEEMVSDIAQSGMLDSLSRCRIVAEELYTKGYCKQSEGEWIKHAASYECTACKKEISVDGYAEDYDPITDWDLYFCPNCGAKMKGA